MNKIATKSKLEKIRLIFLYVVFGCYILFLIKLLLLSRTTLERRINLVPFSSIWEYAFSDADNLKKFSFANIVGNVLVFLPLGAYLTLLKKNKKITINLLFVFVVSLCVEIIQWIFGLGTADVDDIILNCLGGFIGILGYWLIFQIFRDQEKVHIVFAIASLIGLPYLLFLIFMVRLRL